jgi:hypothetical protein
LSASEDLIQLNGADGHFSYDLPDQDCRLAIEWQPEHFPSVLLWYSNKGLTGAPWQGRHTALGIEPICSPFGLGLSAARGPNPIAASGTPTAILLHPSKPFVTRYRLSASRLSAA